MRFADQVVVVTGGASGIGRETCLMFAREGAAVVCADLNGEEAERVAADIRAAGGAAVAYAADVTDRRGSVDPLAEEIRRRYGRLDVLINNAGITGDAQFLNMPEALYDRVVAVNQKGVFNCTQALAPIMIERGYGRIINTSSIVALYGNFGQTAYVAAKAAVIGMTKTWAKELGRKGITVNAVAPGFIDTPMTQGMKQSVLEMYRQKVPAGRLGAPGDVARAFLFLADRDSSYINGAVLEINGGLSM